jgi:hypothetical protein
VDLNAATKPDIDTHPGIDANVLFYLTLPLKTAANHKGKPSIRLAYDQKEPKT